MSRLFKFDEFASKKSENLIPDLSTNISIHKQEPIMHNISKIEESMNVLVWRGVMMSEYFSHEEKTGIYYAMKRANVSNQSMNESVLTRMREILPKLKEDGTEVKEEVIDKLEKIMKSSGAFSKYLADLIIKAWDRALSFYKTKLDGAKTDVFARVKLMRREGHDINDDIKSEVISLKDIVMFWLKQFPGMVAKSIIQNYSKAIMKESLEVSADIHSSLMKFKPSSLNEDNDALWSFMDEITDQLKDVEPFKTISSVRSFDGVEPEKFSEAFVKYTEDAGGPKIKKFVLLPYVMEEVTKYRNGSMSKNTTDQILKSEGVLKFLPMNKEILTIVEALAISVISMEAMMKMKELGESVYKK